MTSLLQASQDIPKDPDWVWLRWFWRRTGLSFFQKAFSVCGSGSGDVDGYKAGVPIVFETAASKFRADWHISVKLAIKFCRHLSRDIANFLLRSFCFRPAQDKHCVGIMGVFGVATDSERRFDGVRFNDKIWGLASRLVCPCQLYIVATREVNKIARPVLYPWVEVLPCPDRDEVVILVIRFIVSFVKFVNYTMILARRLVGVGDRSVFRFYVKVCEWVGFPVLAVVSVVSVKRFDASFQNGGCNKASNRDCRRGQEKHVRIDLVRRLYTGTLMPLSGVCKPVHILGGCC